jgi:predicted glutamine amidotransferase
MCRLFGFRSVIQSQVHRSLVAAENALAVQSRKHVDGWGVAYYVAGAPHVIKSTQPAGEDRIFQHLSGVVASETVLAHLRKATVGEVNILNSHPFQFGSWVMAHNGEVYDFERVRAPLRAQIQPQLQRYILGETDSEVIFYLFLTRLSRLTELHRRGARVEDIVRALSETIQIARALADGDGEDERSKLTLLVTNGDALVAARSRMPLRYSTWKSRCLDRDHCPFLSDECEAPTKTGKVNHLLVSSEALGGENVWEELGEDHFVAVDWSMHLSTGPLPGAPPIL